MVLARGEFTVSSLTDGATGRGISSIVRQFYLSTSKTTQTGGSWSTTMPTWETGKYVWIRDFITYTTGTPATETTTPLVSSEWEAVNGVPSYIASRGENLLTNGTGLLGTNQNFPGYVFSSAEAYGSGGSFADTLSATRITDEFMPVNPDDTYRLTLYAKQQKGAPEKALTRHYTFVDMYDADKRKMTTSSVMWFAGTLTTLAQDLKPGDTTVYLTSAANWKNAQGVNTHQRSFIFWQYQNSGGYTYPPETYSRYYSGADKWADGAVNYAANTITLRAPWAYSNPKDANGYWRAGHPLSNGSAGGTYKYGPLVNTEIPETWTKYSGVWKGTDLSGTNVSNKFFPGTAFVKIGWLNHYEAGQTSGTAATNNTVFYSNLTFCKDTNKILSTTTQYYLSGSSSTVTGGAWLDTMPTWTMGKYLWERSKSTWEDGTITYEPAGGVLATSINQANQSATTALADVVAHNADLTAHGIKFTEISQSVNGLGEVVGTHTTNISELTATSLEISQTLGKGGENLLPNPTFGTKNMADKGGWSTGYLMQLLAARFAGKTMAEMLVTLQGKTIQDLIDYNY